MQFTKFGQTGLTVSRMTLGTGTFGKQTDEKEAHRMLDKAAEAGIDFIDTADVYHLARRSVVLKSSQAAGSAISGQGLSSAQRAAEKWGQPLGTQAARENTCSTPSTLPCAASIRITLIFTNCIWTTPLHRSTKWLGPWIRSCVRAGRVISAYQTFSPTVWQKRLDGRTR